MQYSQLEHALDEAFKKWVPVIAQKVIEEMEARFKMDYIKGSQEKNAKQKEVTNG